ncbi:hypothetical protein F5B19DRAFT_479459 [Rostrohypoxylon terebratum]|nr:hypothetical protein F5B19DRAFT_479459 [Rostrohypoxylon terebratum]
MSQQRARATTRNGSPPACKQMFVAIGSILVCGFFLANAAIRITAKVSADADGKVLSLPADRPHVKTHYEILGIPNCSPDEDIRTARRHLARKWHPDLFVGETKQAATEKMAQINDAHDYLLDYTLRCHYDAKVGCKTQHLIDCLDERERQFQEKRTRILKERAERAGQESGGSLKEQHLDKKEQYKDEDKKEQDEKVQEEKVQEGELEDEKVQDEKQQDEDKREQHEDGGNRMKKGVKRM